MSTRAMPWLLSAAVLAGCSSSQSPGASSSSGSSSSSSASSSGAPAARCPGPAADQSTVGGDGPGTIRGTVSWPVGAVGKTVYVGLNHDQADFASVTWPADSTMAGTSATFEYTNLQPGTYFLNAAISGNTKETLDDTALGGFFAGTTAHPFGAWNATPLVVTATPICDANFAIGPIPCYASWGAACTQDNECRATVCACAGGSTINVTAGACAPATKTCGQVATDADCAKKCAPAQGSARQGNCTND